MRRLDVLLVDGSGDFMDAVSGWLSADPSFRVIGTVDRGDEAVATVTRETPDIVFVDTTVPGIHGFRVARDIKDLPTPPLVFLTTFHDSETARREASAAGADGLIAKSDFAAGLDQVLQTVEKRRSIRTATGRATQDMQWPNQKPGVSPGGMHEK